MILQEDSMRAFIKNENLKLEFLKNKKIIENELKNYDDLTELRQAIITDIVVDVMKEHAPIKLDYPSPTYVAPNSITLYGTRGFYIVTLEFGGVRTFDNKQEAHKFAREQSNMSCLFDRTSKLFERLDRK